MAMLAFLQPTCLRCTPSLSPRASCSPARRRNTPVALDSLDGGDRSNQPQLPVPLWDGSSVSGLGPDSFLPCDAEWPDGDYEEGPPGNGPAGGGGNGSGGGDGDAGDGEDEAGGEVLTAVHADGDSQLQEILRSYGRTLDSLPKDVAMAVSKGAITAAQLRAYLGFETKMPVIGPIIKWWKPFRDRVLSDDKFIAKLLIQEIVGNGTALASEIAVRGGDIWDELEYVASDLIVGTFVEASFVWILAPRVPFPALQTPPRSAVARWLQSLPANSFEQSSPARRFTLAQRAGSFVSSAVSYAATGFGSGIAGTVITYGLVEGRKAVDGGYTAERSLPPIWANSAGWAAFMGLSGNTRFQVLEGVERAVGTMGAGAPAVTNAAIVGLRFANNYWGGVQFVRFFRWLGLQETSESE